MSANQQAAPAGGDRHDLPLVLFAGALSAMALGGVALVALRAETLPIPGQQALVVAGLVGLLSAGGWVALRAGQPVRRVGWVVLVLYTLLATAAVHLTGGPQTPM